MEWYDPLLLALVVLLKTKLATITFIPESKYLALLSENDINFMLSFCKTLFSTEHDITTNNSVFIDSNSVL